MIFLFYTVEKNYFTTILFCLFNNNEKMFGIFYKCFDKKFQNKKINASKVGINCNKDGEIVCVDNKKYSGKSGWS